MPVSITSPVLYANWIGLASSTPCSSLIDLLKVKTTVISFLMPVGKVTITLLPLNFTVGSSFKTGAIRIPAAKLFSSIYSENVNSTTGSSRRTVPLGGFADNNTGGVVSFGPPLAGAMAAHFHDARVMHKNNRNNLLFIWRGQI